MKSIDELVLTKGSHRTPDHGLCVMEAVAYVYGEEHTDMPNCVSPVISSFCQILNDKGGDAVRERLKPFIYKVIGTGDQSPELEQQRAFIAADYAVRVFAGVECEPVVDAVTARAAAAAAATAATAAANAAATYDDAATAAAYAAYAYAAYAYAAYAANATADANAVWDSAFECLSAMIWPIPAPR